MEVELSMYAKGEEKDMLASRRQATRLLPHTAAQDTSEMRPRTSTAKVPSRFALGARAALVEALGEEEAVDLQAAAEAVILVEGLEGLRAAEMLGGEEGEGALRVVRP